MKYNIVYDGSFYYVENDGIRSASFKTLRRAEKELREVSHNIQTTKIIDTHENLLERKYMKIFYRTFLYSTIVILAFILWCFLLVKEYLVLLGILSLLYFSVLIAIVCSSCDNDDWRFWKYK